VPGHAPRHQLGPYHTVAAPGALRDRLRRIVGLDDARALAVFGSWVRTCASAADIGASPSTWLGVVNDRPSPILFAILAGISVSAPDRGVPQERAR
jgi:hypothetical protein